MPPSQTASPINTRLLRVRRKVFIELNRQPTHLEKIIFIVLGILGGVLLFALPLLLVFAHYFGESEFKELLKGMQFIAKFAAAFGGVLAFFNHKSFTRYVIGLFIASFAVDFGTDTFMYYTSDSTLKGPFVEILQGLSVLFLTVGVGGLVCLTLLSTVEFILTRRPKPHSGPAPTP